MATLYVGGRVFDGEKVLDGQAVLEEDGKVKRVAPAAEFTGFSGDKVDPYRAPGMGEHNAEIYSEQLGVSKEELARLEAARVI